MKDQIKFRILCYTTQVEHLFPLDEEVPVDALWKPRPHYAEGIWKPRFHSENVFRPH